VGDAPAPSEEAKPRKKRKADDEIDALFGDAGLARRRKKGVLPAAESAENDAAGKVNAESVDPKREAHVEVEREMPAAEVQQEAKKRKKAKKVEVGVDGMGLGDVLGAIKSAPQGESRRGKGKKDRPKL
jgi:prophage tail gpP-like protein